MAYNLALGRASSGFVVVAQPAPVKIPDQFQAGLRVGDVDIRKRQPRDIIHQFAARAQFNLTGVPTGGCGILSRNPGDTALLDLERVTLLDAVEQVLSDHALDALPIVRADGVPRFQICLGGLNG